MNKFNFLPEGWNTEKYKITSNEEIEKCANTEKICQGIVEKCDNNYNLHINIGNNIIGIMPREEVEGINIEQNGLPKQNLCTGKVHKFVQFKIKGLNEQHTPILSRKSVQEEAMEAVKKDLEVGDKINGIVKNITPYGAFIEIGGGVVGLAHIEDLFVCEDEKHMAETFKEIITNQVEIPQLKLYFTTDLRQNEETLENTLVEFKLVDGKYKMENIELKLLGM